MKVLVCGSREFADPFVIALAIDRRIAALPPSSHVIHGAARGADSMADEAAVRHGHLVERFPADWRLGKHAGIERNLRMLREKPDLVIAFWNGESTGTAHTISEAHKRGIPVEVIAA